MTRRPEPAATLAVSLVEELERRADTSGDEVGVQHVDVGTTHTWSELRADMRRWAGAMQTLGVVADDTVAILLPNCIEGLVGWLGVAMLRAVATPINTMYRGRLLAHVLNDSGAAVLVVHSDYLDALRGVADELAHLRTVVVVGDVAGSENLPFTIVGASTLRDSATPIAGLPPPEPHDVACLVYTSGTTGPSKGVVIPWRQMQEVAAAIPAELFEQGRGVYTFSPSFHLSGKRALWTASLHGCRLVMRTAFSASSFWEDVRTYDCTTTTLIGSVGAVLMRKPPRPDDRNNPMLGLAMMPLIADFQEFGDRFGVKICTGYGMTEIGPALASTGFEIEDWQSCGRVRHGYELRIVDEHDEEVPHGELGELVVRTDRPWMLCLGYWRRPEATARAWRNGWFHTGDGFRRDSKGNFYFVDRLKDAIRRRGENISSFEVEQYVLDHPSVESAAAIGVPSELTEDDVKVFVVLRPGEDVSPRALLEYLEPRMPSFMLPRYAEVVATLPMTPTMRVMKHLLREVAFSETTWDRERKCWLSRDLS